MRLLPVVLTAAIAGATMASAGYGQRADDQINPRSSELSRQAQTALGAGNQTQANDLYETALVVDPRNRDAYIGLARVAQAQRLPGKAIRLYADALTIEPNDINALTGQGEAYVQRGAVDRARRNLDRVRQLCGNNACPQVAQLTAAIDRGPPVETAASTTPAAPISGNSQVPAGGNTQQPRTPPGNSQQPRQ